MRHLRNVCHFFSHEMALLALPCACDYKGWNGKYAKKSYTYVIIRQKVMLFGLVLKLFKNHARLCNYSCRKVIVAFSNTLSVWCTP